MLSPARGGFLQGWLRQSPLSQPREQLLQAWGPGAGCQGPRGSEFLGLLQALALWGRVPVQEAGSWEPWGREKEEVWGQREQFCLEMA